MQPSLTIAIPTYNRSELLDRLLSQISLDPAFDSNKIEVLVCDNASTDNTKEVVAKYSFVSYHQNQQNIGFANFTIAMSKAQGAYIKIFNDSVILKENAIGKILEVVESSDQSENIIFANPLIGCIKADITVQTSSEIVGVLSYLITWIANVGMWKTDFDKLETPNRFVTTLMQHVDWILSFGGNGKETRIIVDSYIEVEDIKKKGSYNIFDTFINKYFSILKFHKIGFFAFEKEKYRLFRYFILIWYFKLKRDTEYEFDTQGANKIILKSYWYEPYFWVGLVVFAIRKIIHQ